MDHFSDQIDTGNCPWVVSFYDGGGPTASEQNERTIHALHSVWRKKGEHWAWASVFVGQCAYIFFVWQTQQTRFCLFPSISASTQQQNDENDARSRVRVRGSMLRVRLNNKQQEQWPSFVEHFWPGTHLWGVGVLISHCRAWPLWFSVDSRIALP